MTSQIAFTILLFVMLFLFARNVSKVIRNIRLGREIAANNRKAERWYIMLKVAFGQSKMGKRPIAALMHLFVYIGFIIINIEVLEIILDGILGTHRIFSSLGTVYDILIGAFEILALLVLIGVGVFLARRILLKVRRFAGIEMTTWPRRDALYILIIETLLMLAFLFMNAADYKLQLEGYYYTAGYFPVSQHLIPLLPDHINTLEIIERFCWWFHIIGILLFLNYLPFSKHFHIILAFPNTWYSKLDAKGKLENMESVSNEVKAMLNPSVIPPTSDNKFGAKDITDLTRIQLLNAYTCTECGRCTAVCPANITGKLLSPRKIMMDTRDRMEEIGRSIDRHGKDFKDEKSLLDDYISREEIWACTTCNACVEACPVNIDPLSIIIDLRRYAVMEEAKVEGSLNAMFANIENNGAPWRYAPSDRFNWKDKL